MPSISVYLLHAALTSALIETIQRIYAFFRNPVDRCVSKFYYLQTATWERTYRPEWVGMSLTEWATDHNFDENFLVKKINGKP